MNINEMDGEAKKILDEIKGKTLTPKERMAIAHQEMPSQDPKERISNMNEVALGYTESMAMAEASRCLDCKNKPCVEGCPVSIDIPSFISRVAKGDHKGAYEVISSSSILPAICGRVCPQEVQCQKYCTLGKALKDVDIKDDAFKHVEAIIYSMTPYERKNPQVLNASRKQRIAKGSGRDIQEVNRLLKQFDDMRKMMKMVQSKKLPNMRRR